MRKILYKAKDRDGNWIEGNLVDSKPMSCSIVNFDGNGRIWTSINKNTVCQFTGMLDKNGKKIFEGDIVVPSCFKNYKPYHLKVIFKNAMFGLECKKPFLTKFKSLHAFMDKAINANSPIEIIGNIFDNPELL